jgi:DNA-binding GntR family transcriptional regulator
MDTVTRLERPRPLRDQVHERLRTAILSGQMAPGTPVIEAEIAASLGASRTPVREALRRLESEGLLEPRGLRGTVVREIRADEVQCIYEIREALETLAARRASRRMSESDAVDMDRLLVRLEAAIDDVSEFERIGAEFSDRIIDLADGQRLHRMLSDLRADIVAWRMLSLSRPERRPEIIRENRAILEALRGKDEEAVAAAVAIHIANARDSVLIRLKETAQNAVSAAANA